MKKSRLRQARRKPNRQPYQQQSTRAGREQVERLTKGFLADLPAYLEKQIQVLNLALRATEQCIAGLQARLDGAVQQKRAGANRRLRRIGTDLDTLRAEAKQGKRPALWRLLTYDKTALEEPWVRGQIQAAAFRGDAVFFDQLARALCSNVQPHKKTRERLRVIQRWCLENSIPDLASIREHREQLLRALRAAKLPMTQEALKKFLTRHRHELFSPLD